MTAKHKLTALAESIIEHSLQSTHDNHTRELVRYLHLSNCGSLPCMAAQTELVTAFACTVMQAQAAQGTQYRCEVIEVPGMPECFTVVRIELLRQTTDEDHGHWVPAFCAGIGAEYARTFFIGFE